MKELKIGYTYISQTPSNSIYIFTVIKILESEYEVSSKSGTYMYLTHFQKTSLIHEYAIELKDLELFKLIYG